MPDPLPGDGFRKFPQESGCPECRIPVNLNSKKKMMNWEQASLDYHRIEKAIEYISSHRNRQPGLEEIAAHVHLSPYHFQRLFTRWAGVSPKKFLQYLTIKYAKEQLRQNISFEEVAFTSGLSGTGRLHDLFISVEGMTPGQYRSGGKGIRIHYGFHHSPFGPYLLAVTEEGRICSLQFTGDPRFAVRELKEQWYVSQVEPDASFTSALASQLFDPGVSSKPGLLLRGTPFQLKVWEALLRIPPGSMVSYQTIAGQVGNPKGLQAVGSAIGKNPVAWLIPCHRVIRKTGGISEYRWGSSRKAAILGWEAARAGN
jgi:AraC family transcriptional regulator of adaptative response/methylated-DNA-[protein]-cysteine methyltransferase